MVDELEVTEDGRHVISGTEGMSHHRNATCFPDQFDRFSWGQFHDFNKRRFSSSEETSERFADCADIAEVDHLPSDVRPSD